MREGYTNRLLSYIAPAGESCKDRDNSIASDLTELPALSAKHNQLEINSYYLMCRIASPPKFLNGLTRWVKEILTHWRIVQRCDNPFASDLTELPAFSAKHNQLESAPTISYI